MARPFIFTEENIEKAIYFKDNPKNPREYRAGIMFLMMTT
jgi:hypothetical protein